MILDAQVHILHGGRHIGLCISQLKALEVNDLSPSLDEIVGSEGDVVGEGGVGGGVRS